MDGPTIEVRLRDSSTVLTQDIASHIYKTRPQLKIVILVPVPQHFLGPLRKQWHRLIRQTQKERSSTLTASRILALGGHLNWMQRVSFGARTDSGKLVTDITLAKLDAFISEPPACSMLYVTEPVDKDQLEYLISKIPPYGRVVVYKGMRR